MPMNRFLLLSSLALLGGCQAEPPSLSEAERASLAEEVRGVMARLTEAMNAHDAPGVLGFYADTEDYVYVGCTDPMFGSEFFKGVVGPFYEGNPEVTFEREILRIQVLSPTTAVATLQGRSTQTEGLFWSHILSRGEDGRWLIHHEHASWPGCRTPPPLHPTGADTAGMGGGS